MARSVGAAVALLMAVVAVGGCGDGPRPGAPAASPAAAVTVVASTTLTGALATAAGAARVTPIVPADVADPAGYEPTDAQLAAAASADVVVLAATDRFAGRLRAVVAYPDRLVVVRPGVDKATVTAQVTALAERLGTQAAAGRWVAAYARRHDEIVERGRGLNPLPRWTAVADRAVADWLAFMDLRRVGLFGPSRPRPAQVRAWAAAQPRLVVADAHRMAAAPTVPGAAVVAVRVYPDARMDLDALVRRNVAAFTAAFTGRIRPAVPAPDSGPPLVVPGS